MVWDDGTIRHLRALWVQGLSTAEIGRRLGVSKNAIVGKAHRLDLEGRPSPIRRDAAKSPADPTGAELRPLGVTLPPLPSAQVSNLVPAVTVQPLRIVSVAPPSAAIAPPPPPPAAVPARRSAPSCCWPIGEPGTKSFRFCDDASMTGKPYCEEHAKLAYVRIKDRKEDAA